MHFVFSTDNNYLPHLAAAIHSILGCHAHTEVDFWVVYNDCSDTQLQTFIAAVAPAKVTLLADEMLSEKELFVSRHISKTTYQRLFLDRILPQSVTRYLYLDCDLLVIGNLQELYHTNLHGCIIAAAPEYAQDLFFSNIGNVSCFNAGVLLVDRVAWQSAAITEKLEAYMVQEGENLQYWDQDALNAVLQDKWLPVSPKWNATVVYFRDSKKMRKYKAHEVYADTRIVHFNASLKPWHYRLRHKYKTLYLKYLPEPYRSSFFYPDKNYITIFRRAIAFLFVYAGLKRF